MSSKPQIKEIRKNLYDIKTQKDLSKRKIKQITESQITETDYRKYLF